jgi:putative hemolysin
MSELAIVSARPARLKILADKGSKGAATAIRLAEDPGRFLSSVQIGITLMTSLLPNDSIAKLRPSPSLP